MLSNPFRNETVFAPSEDFLLSLFEPTNKMKSLSALFIVITIVVVTELCDSLSPTKPPKTFIKLYLRKNCIVLYCK